MIKCQVCGYDNQDSAEFCLNCGATIERQKLGEAIDDISAERTVVLDPRAFQTPAPAKMPPSVQAPPPPAAAAPRAAAAAPPPPASAPRSAPQAAAPALSAPSAPPAMPSAPNARPAAPPAMQNPAAPRVSTPSVSGAVGVMDSTTKMIIIGLGALIVVLLVVLIMVMMK